MINEEETDEEQIEGAREDFNAGRFEKLRITRIRKEIRELNKDIEFQKRGGALYFIFANISLNLYPEDKAFALNIAYGWNGVARERELKLLLTMAVIAKKHGFKEKG